MRRMMAASKPTPRWKRKCRGTAAGGVAEPSPMRRVEKHAHGGEPYPDAVPRPAALRALDREIVECRACPRLVEWRELVAAEKRASFRDDTYWGRPVPGFGDTRARVLVAGLAPAAHGA